jgi:hypothetical protein
MAHILHELALLRQIQRRLSEAISLAERARSIYKQVLGDAHPKTVATHALYTHLIQQQETCEQEQCPLRTMNVAVRGATEQVAYSRTVRMREVTFTCAVCGQTVTQLHYPSGRLKYCSEACRAVGAIQRQQTHAARQREKRHIKREAQRRAL